MKVTVSKHGKYDLAYVLAVINNILNVKIEHFFSRQHISNVLTH